MTPPYPYYAWTSEEWAQVAKAKALATECKCQWWDHAAITPVASVHTSIHRTLIPSPGQRPDIVPYLKAPPSQVVGANSVLVML